MDCQRLGLGRVLSALVASMEYVGWYMVVAWIGYAATNDDDVCLMDEKPPASKKSTCLEPNATTPDGEI